MRFSKARRSLKSPQLSVIGCSEIEGFDMRHMPQARVHEFVNTEAALVKSLDHLCVRFHHAVDAAVSVVIDRVRRA